MKFISVILSTSIFALLFIEFFHPLTAITQDLGRHMKTGEIIVQTHHVPKTNLFSYTYPNFPFINSHWLSEVIFYWIFTLVGFHGLLVFTTLVTIIAFGILFFSLLPLSSSLFTLYAFIAASLLYLGILSERTDVRPEIFSFLFLAIFISILYKYREKYTHLIFILPILELFWVNMHIYFVIGEVLIGLFLIEKIIRGILGHYDTRILRVTEYKRLKRSPPNIFISQYLNILVLFAVFLLAFLATFLNPNGIQVVFYPFTVFNNYGYSIQENQNIFFLLQFGSSTTITFFIITTFLLFFLLLINIKKSRIIDWLLALVFTYVAASAIRNFVLFVFVTFIPFTYALTSLLQTLWQQHPRSKDLHGLLTGCIFLLLMLAITWEGSFFISKHGFGWNVPTGAQPASDFFLRNHLRGPIFNNFDIGSYLDYRLYPQEKVFVDGRPEAYPASFFQQTYIPMQSRVPFDTRPGQVSSGTWQNDRQILLQQEKKYHFNTIFFAHTDQTPWAANFVRQIMNNQTWKPVYLDSSIVILIKNTNQNKDLIKKFGMDKNSARIDNLSSSNLTQLFYLANFFVNAGWTNQEAKIDQIIIQNDQNNCVALSRLAAIYAGENNALANVYETKYRQVCQ